MKNFWNNRLAREISLVLLIKFLLLFALWFAFFRHPMDKDLDAISISRAVLGPQFSNQIAHQGARNDH